MNNVRKMPDAYMKRDADGYPSNHAKMLKLNELPRDEFKVAMQQVLDSLDIDIATGVTLDKFGETINQKRGVLNDIQYRFMLYFQIAKLLNKGDYNSIMYLACVLLNCNEGDLVIQDFEGATQGATVEIVSLPLAVLLKEGFTYWQVIDMIKELLPCGVNISEANFIGTFELGDWDTSLSDEENEANLYDESGLVCFADKEETIGGYLGHTMQDRMNDKGEFELPM